jgi:hypothetical protein
MHADCHVAASRPIGIRATAVQYGTTAWHLSNQQQCYNALELRLAERGGGNGVPGWLSRARRRYKATAIDAYHYRRQRYDRAI